MARFIPKFPRRLPHFHIPFFRIFYSTTYTFLYLLTLIMLSINPAVMIYTAFDEDTYQYVFEIGGVYILTAVLAVFIYLSRLYTNRSVMAAVGKSYIPVEEGEVPYKVRKMIVRKLERSAVIALESRPRHLTENVSNVTTTSSAVTNEKVLAHPTVGRVLKIDPRSPPWGRIQHPGWSSPSSSDTNLAPHVQFRTVILELPNLIEARAVSLAPPDPYATPTGAQYADPVVPDPVIVEILQRKAHTDLRAYLGQLSELGVLGNPELGDDFLWQYERARFSCVPLKEAQFEDLMESFAFLLTSMQEVRPTIVGEARADRLAVDNADTLSISVKSSSSSSMHSSIAGSVRRVTPRPLTKGSSLYRSGTLDSYDTAPTSAMRSRTPGAFSIQTDNTTDKFRPETAITNFSTLGSDMKRQVSRETFGSLGSVLRTPALADSLSVSSGSSKEHSLRSRSMRSYAGSVIRHSGT